MSLRVVLAVGEFRALCAAELLSWIGDQLARVALTILVYQRTSSAGLTGLTYALTFLPSMLGGVLLGGLADRYPRREVMITLDLLCAAFLGLMAIPGMPLLPMCALLSAVTFLRGPYKAAQLAFLADVLTGDRYTAGLVIRHIIIQSAQVAGFAGGGVLVARVGASSGLAIDAVTFVAAALLIAFGCRHRPAMAREDRKRISPGSGLMVVWRDPRLRSLTALCWLAGFHVAPEGLAAPYAATLGAGSVAVGLILASDPVGSVIGAFVFGRLVPERIRVKTVGLLGAITGLPLILCVFHPGLVASIVIFAFCGALAMSYQLQVGASFVRIVPDESRAQGLGVMSSGLITAQGLGTLAAGALADVIGPAVTVAVAGAAAVVIGAQPALTWTRALRSPSPMNAELAR
ncbi:MFS transporter [Sphaerisporangium corydalis]|uniref:MFS transporter n=1 Tax=Sphaerisporangium corydalis TaxID=1441875 RepID=A0ABV9E8C4_9ACTN|nr:MFS transporter [Sphaerisporangium corydalis]